MERNWSHAPKLAGLSSSSRDLAPQATTALKQHLPHSSTLQPRSTTQDSCESPAPVSLVEPPQSRRMAEEDHRSQKFGASRLVRQPLSEQFTHKSLILSKIPGPAISLFPNLSNFADVGTSNSRHFHPLPLQSSVAPLSKPYRSLKPQDPALRDRKNGSLYTADSRHVRFFTIHAIVLLGLENLTTRDYPASVMIRRTLQDFNQWYRIEAGGDEIPALKFKLLDESGDYGKEFVLTRGDSPRFQTLKQHVWDRFWAVMSMDGGAAKFRILITPQRTNDEVASYIAPALLANPISTYGLGNINVAADHPLQATTVSQRSCGPPSYCPPPLFTRDIVDTTIPQVRSIPCQVNHFSRQPPNSIKDPSPSHHNNTWINAIAGLLDTSRTTNDKELLWRHAAKLIDGREDVELEEDETTGGRNRVHPYACGAVVDKSSAKGLVIVTDRGFPVQQVDTGQGLIGEIYADLTIGVGQTCIIYGSSTVLYYKPRKGPASIMPNHPR